jgi:hypothetical protein
VSDFVNFLCSSKAPLWMLAANYLAAEPECSPPPLKQLAFGHNA